MENVKMTNAMRWIEAEWTDEDRADSKRIAKALVLHDSPIRESDFKKLLGMSSIGWAFPYLKREHGIGRLMDWSRGTESDRYIYFLASHVDRRGE